PGMASDASKRASSLPPAGQRQVTPPTSRVAPLGTDGALCSACGVAATGGLPATATTVDTGEAGVPAASPATPAAVVATATPVAEASVAGVPTGDAAVDADVTVWNTGACAGCAGRSRGRVRRNCCPG